MALVDLLDTRSNHQFVKKNIVSANCNKAKYNKTKYVCTQKRKEKKVWEPYTGIPDNFYFKRK